MKTKTSDLSGISLDWAVDKCEANQMMILSNGKIANHAEYSSDWFQGGPIIERERIDIAPLILSSGWVSWADTRSQYEGDTPLIAAMRCYVASKLGEEVETPDELINKE